MTIAAETAGTAADDQNLVVKGEGPAATLTLDGSDDVAGSVTVDAIGKITPTGGIDLRTAQATALNVVLRAGSAANGYFYVGNAEITGYDSAVIVDNSQSLQIMGTGGVLFEGATDNTNETKLVAADPTADRTITLPDATGTVVLNVRVVTPDIDGETTTLANSATTWTNTGDGDGEAITLLNDPGIGANYCFAVDVAQTITVAPSTGETLYYGTDNCVASLTSNAIGSTLCVTAITGGSGAKWFTMSHEGSWTCND